MTSEYVAEAESVEAAKPRLTKAVDDQLIDELVGVPKPRPATDR